MGQSTISLAIFNSYVSHNQRVATITSRLVFFFIGIFRSQPTEVQAVGALLPTAVTSPEWPDVARVGYPRGTGNLGKNILDLSGKSLFHWYLLGQFLEIWETTWRFLVNFHGISRFFFARLPRIVACNQVRRSLMFLDGSFSGRQEVQGFAIPLTAAFGILQGLSKRPSNPASLRILEGSRRLQKLPQAFGRRGFQLHQTKHLFFGIQPPKYSAHFLFQNMSGRPHWKSGKSHKRPTRPTIWIHLGMMVTTHEMVILGMVYL